MKKLIALLVAVLFAVSMTGLCFAQAEKATPAVPAKADDKAVKADDKKVDKKKADKKDAKKKADKKDAKKKDAKKKDAKKAEKKDDKGATPAVPAEPAKK